MHQHEHVDFRIDARGRRVHLADFGEFLDPVDNGPGRDRFARARVVAFGDIKPGHDPDHGRVGIHQRPDETRDIVFEEALALGLEELDDLDAIGAVGRDQAEKQPGIVAGAGRNRFETVLKGTVARLRQGFGVDRAHIDATTGQGLVFLEQFPYTLCVLTHERHALGGVVREVQRELDRLIDILDDSVRGLGQGIQTVLGQIDACPDQQGIGEQHDGDKEDAGKRDTGNGLQSATRRETHRSFALFHFDDGDIREQEEHDQSDEIDQIPQFQYPAPYGLEMRLE